MLLRLFSTITKYSSRQLKRRRIHCGSRFQRSQSIWLHCFRPVVRQNMMIERHETDRRGWVGGGNLQTGHTSLIKDMSLHPSASNKAPLPNSIVMTQSPLSSATTWAQSLPHRSLWEDSLYSTLHLFSLVCPRRVFKTIKKSHKFQHSESLPNDADCV